MLSKDIVYVVSETPQPDYTASEWGGDCAPDGGVTLVEGDAKECTITNDDVPDEEEVTTTTALPPEEPTTSTAPPATTATTTATTEAPPTELPRTGAGSLLAFLLAGLGMVSLGGGLVLLGSARRREAWIA